MIVKYVSIKLILLKTFTTGGELGLILRLCWFVNVPMNVLAVVIIEDGTGVHWRIVMLIAFVGILRKGERRTVPALGPKDVKNENLIQIPKLSRLGYA